jgi:hypothetical protein
MRVSAFPRPPHFCSSIPSETDRCLFSRTGKFRTSFSLCEAKAIKGSGEKWFGSLWVAQAVKILRMGHQKQIADGLETVSTLAPPPPHTVADRYPRA